ncbi:MAG: carboxylating nicotinate-nucleotide diphosphorylase [Flammeovirgaceae bacterium]
MNPEYITEQSLKTFIVSALQEDVGDGDHSSLSSVPADAIGKARLLVKDTGVLAGVEAALAIFKEVDADFQLEVIIKDGSEVKKGDVAFLVRGKAQKILTAERLVLNTMQRMSGIATKTRRIVKLLEGTNTQVLDTRKTTPNFRMMEKWAVMIGGGKNHRYGLFDMIMLKDNHIDYAGGVANALKAAKNYLYQKGKNLKIEVETRTLAEVEEALSTGLADVIMLDNMPVAMMKEAVKIIGNKCLTEASGNLTEETVRQVAETGVNFVSMGALTHSAGILDLSLKAYE